MRGKSHPTPALWIPSTFSPKVGTVPELKTAAADQVIKSYKAIA
jgi:hypothetical protein